MHKMLRCLDNGSYDLALKTAVLGRVCPTEVPWGHRQLAYAINSNTYGWAKYAVTTNDGARLRDSQTRTTVKAIIAGFSVQATVLNVIGPACAIASLGGILGSCMVVRGPAEVLFTGGLISFCGYGATQWMADGVDPYVKLRQHVSDIELELELKK